MKPENKYKVRFEAKQTAIVEIEANSIEEAQVMAKRKYLADGLEGEWRQGTPRITKVRPVTPRKKDEEYCDWHERAHGPKLGCPKCNLERAAEQY
jgi:hypothetical protein